MSPLVSEESYLEFEANYIKNARKKYMTRKKTRNNQSVVNQRIFAARPSV